MPTAAAARVPSSPTASAILPLILVFLCGVTVGALVMNVGLHRNWHRAIPNYESRNNMTLETWKRELNLTEDQSQKIESILDDFSKYYDNVLADGNSRILLILNDAQKQKFQQLMKERR
jgi:pyrroline-5-carboxylate reductase